MQSSYLLVLCIKLLLHLQVSCCCVGDLSSANLANLTEHRFVMELGSFDKRISLVDCLREYGVKLWALRSELDGVVYCVLDLAYHVLGTLEFKVPQVHLN